LLKGAEGLALEVDNVGVRLRDENLAEMKVSVDADRQAAPAVLGDYTGMFSNPGYGDLVVSRSGDNLNISYYGLSWPLQPLSDTTFRFVIRAFGDYDFESLKGSHETPFLNGRLLGSSTAQEKMSSSWTVGGRVPSAAIEVMQGTIRSLRVY